LLSALDHLGANRILHRDLKTQNILISDCTQVKICDYGLSRLSEFDSRPYSNNVVSLWYRAPELLLGSTEYTAAIDVWSLGCIFYELVMKVPPFKAKSEAEQLTVIFDNLGIPKKEDFANISHLPKFVESKKTEASIFSKLPREFIESQGFDLMMKMFIYNQDKRITPKQALNHDYFAEKW